MKTATFGQDVFGFTAAWVMVRVCWLSVSLAIPLPAATHYVDCVSGKDGNGGLDPGTAWQTLARANQHT